MRNGINNDPGKRQKICNPDTVEKVLDPTNVQQ